MDKCYDPKKYPVCSRFKTLYTKNHFANVDKSQLIIPKIIHQIWIGGNIPKSFKALAKTWENSHPGFIYKLWTDDDLKTFKFTRCKKAFQRAKNMGAKVDILRYEILYQYGGVYLDIDFECIKPLDPLCHAHSFFAAVGGEDYVANSVIGVIKNHPLLERILKCLEYKTEKELSNPWFETGPKFFTHHVYQFLRKHSDYNMIYPTRFFHPLPNNYRFSYRAHQLSKKFISSFFIPETFAVHYWAESWVGK